MSPVTVDDPGDPTGAHGDRPVAAAGGGVASRPDDDPGGPAMRAVISP
jgi:hypothetical protein